MTITNTIAAKAFGAFVAVAMVLTLAAPAQAQTTEELQQMINDLLSQVASLQSQLGGDSGQSTGAGASDVCPYTWTRDLSAGATGNDVLLLQQFLNADPDTRVAATGVGSAGQETDYYGALTGAAVAKFQTKYRAEVLTPLGLVNATQYFGASSRAQANDLCLTPATPGDDDDDDDDMSEDDDDVELSGIATLDDADMSDGDDTDLEEGQNDAPVAELDLEFQDGDARISHITVGLVGSGDEQDPWDAFEDVSLWVDGDKIAEEAADDEDDYLDDDNGTLRFTGLNLVAEEGEEITITIAVSVQSSVDLGGDSDAWRIDVEEVRYFDGEGVATDEDTTGDIGTGDGVSFDIDEEGGEDELKIQTSTEDPDSTTLDVEENSNSDWHTVFAFDLDTDDSVNDIEVETAVVDVWVNGDVYNQVVNDAQLVIDGQTFDDFTVSNDGTATATLTFDIDKDLVIDAGDEVTAELQLEFKKLSTNYSEGQTVQASTTALLGGNWAAEGADDLSVTGGSPQLSGSVTGEEHTLRTEGVIIEPGDTETQHVENDESSTTDDEGIFTIEFEVTAFETDVYIDDNAASGTVENNTGVNFLVKSGGSVATTDSQSSDLDSSASLESGRFLVNEGETETFTLTVVIDPATAGFHKVELYSVNWNSTNDDADEQQLATPVEDFDTGSLNI